MPSAIIDGIVTRYEVVGSGPPPLMYAPGGRQVLYGTGKLEFDFVHIAR